MGSDHPILQLEHLDTLRFQIAGTLCDLQCNHCFISSSPENHALSMMSFDQFFPLLEEPVQLGVKEFYFTGGEPFVNPDLLQILEARLQVDPATVLSNATPFSSERRGASKAAHHCVHRTHTNICVLLEHANPIPVGEHRVPTRLLSVCEYLKWQASLVTIRSLLAGYIIGIAAQCRNEAEGST
jgi:hypothetical protein